MSTPIERIVFLWLVSKVVSPLIASYCAFIAIAHLFDMFYHLAFFIPILCIDLQRLELQESIARQKPVSSSRFPILSNSENPYTDSWNKLPLSRRGKPQANIRIAGTAVMICFLLALDWQCCSSQTIPRLFRKTLAFLYKKSSRSNTPADFWAELMQTVRPSRSLTSWLYLQNQETAEEILRVMKPTGREFEAIIYDPLVIVVKGANRSDASGKAHLPSISLETLTLPQLIVSTVLVVGSILMAWMVLRVWAPSQIYRGFPPNAALKAIAFQEHDMDIIVIASSNKDTLITVSLDREVFLWRLKACGTLRLEHSFTLENELWPVVAVFISEDSKWAVFCNYKGSVNFWNCETREFESTVVVHPTFSQSSKFFYISSELRRNENFLPRIAIVRTSGWLSEITLRNHEVIHHRIGSAPIYSSLKFATSQPNSSILSLSKDQNVYLTSKVGAAWYSRKLDIQRRPPASLPSTTVVTFPDLNAVYLILSTISKIACIVNAQTREYISPNSIVLV
jgi:WD40 repeat protein